MLYFAQYSALFAVSLAVLWSTGRALEALIWDADELASWRQLARFVVGCSAWIAGLFALASCGWLNGWGLVILAVGLVLAPGAVALHRARLRRPSLPAPRSLAISGLFGLFLLPLFALAMSPPVSWDAAVYHLALPKHFLASGGFRPLPFLVYAHWPLNVELLFAAAMLVKDYILAKMLHFGFGLLTLYALYLGGRNARGPLTGWLAAAFFVANPVVLFELRVAYVDLALAFFFVAGFLFASQAWRAAEERSTWLLLAGLCCGLMAGVKLNGIVGAVLIGIFYLYGLARRTPRAAWGDELSLWLGRFVLPVLALWLPWLIKTWLLTGNPVYPLFHDVLGGPDWNAELGARFAAWQRAIGMGRGLVDYLLLPLRVILAGGDGYEHFDGELGKHWLLLLPLALIVAWRRVAVRQPLALAGAYFVFWALSSQQMRFLLPTVALLALASATALGEALERVGSARLRQGLTVAVLLSTLAVTGWQERALLGSGLKALALYQSRDAGELRQSVVLPVYRFINERLPPEARVLLLNTNQGFFLDRPYVADSFFEASQIAAWLDGAASAEEVRGRFLGRGVSHVLLDRRDRGVPYPPALLQVLSESSELYRSDDGRFVVLAVDPLALGAGLR